MAVTAMGAGDVIVLAQRGASARRDSLLAQVGVQKTGLLPRHKQLDRPLFKAANTQHRQVQPPKQRNG
jgi:hypothetical protein